MKKLFFSLVIIATASLSQAQIVTGTLVDEVGSKKSAVLSASALVSKQDSTGGAGSNNFVTPTFLGAQNFLKLNALSATAPILYNNTTGVFSFSATGTAGTYSFPASITTDAKGLVTSVTAGTAPLTTAGRIEIAATASQTTFTAAGLPASPLQYHFFRNGIMIPLSFTTVAAGSITLTGITTSVGDAITIDWIK